MENAIWGFALFIVPVIVMEIVRHVFELEIVDED